MANSTETLPELHEERMERLSLSKQSKIYQKDHVDQYAKLAYELIEEEGGWNGIDTDRQVAKIMTFSDINQDDIIEAIREASPETIRDDIDGYLDQIKITIQDTQNKIDNVDRETMLQAERLEAIGMASKGLVFPEKHVQRFAELSHELSNNSFTSHIGELEAHVAAVMKKEGFTIDEIDEAVLKVSTEVVGLSLEEEKVFLDKIHSSIQIKSGCTERIDKIEKCIPYLRYPSNPKQDYLRLAKSLKEKGYDLAQIDEKAIRSMLKRGYSVKSVAKTLSNNSPQFTSQESRLAAKQLVQNISQSPEIKRARSQAIGYSR